MFPLESVPINVICDQTLTVAALHQIELLLWLMAGLFPASILFIYWRR